MSAPKLKGKVAIVTGSGRGLGAAIARAYAAEGAAVVVTSRTLENVTHVSADIKAKGGRVLPLQGDVRNEENVQRLVQAAHDWFGRLDVVVNNAAMFVHAARFPRMSEAAWDEAWDTNVKGAWLMAKHASPRMSREGSFINITSGLAREPSAAYAPYSLTKSALEDLTYVLARQLPQRVNAVNPGVVRTAMSNGLGLDPERVTPVFVHLASDESKDVTGQLLDADDFLARGGIMDCPLPIGRLG